MTEQYEKEFQGDQYAGRTKPTMSCFILLQNINKIVVILKASMTYDALNEILDYKYIELLVICVVYNRNQQINFILFIQKITYLYYACQVFRVLKIVCMVININIDKTMP